jgi:hypothetical protein
MGIARFKTGVQTSALASGKFQIRLGAIKSHRRRAEVGSSGGYDAGPTADIENLLTRPQTDELKKWSRKTARPPPHIDFVCRRVAGHKGGRLILIPNHEGVLASRFQPTFPASSGCGAILATDTHISSALRRSQWEDLRQAFANNLRRLRHAKGISQEDLAYEAGINRTYLRKAPQWCQVAGLRRLAAGYPLSGHHNCSLGLKISV